MPAVFYQAGFRAVRWSDAVLPNALKELIAGRKALVVEAQVPIALQIQGMLLDAGAEDVQIAASLQEARPALADGFRPMLAVIDILRLADTDKDLIDWLQREGAAVVLTTVLTKQASFDGISELKVLKKPYLESELSAAIVDALRSKSVG